MRVPFLVIAYGNFAKTKKLFSYERDGVHTLPIFTDASRAHKFATKMTQVLAEHFQERRKLTTQVCTSPVAALEMLETVTAYFPDLMRLVVDPLPPLRDSDKGDDREFMSWTEHFLDIDDAMEEIQGLARSAGGGGGGEANGEPESKAP